jgi:hypothetical protein
MRDFQSVIGEQTFAYKAAATAIIAADTYKAAMAAYSSLAGIPIVGPVLGGIAAGAAVASGGAAIRNVWKADEKSGVTGVSNVTGGGGGAAAAAVSGPTFVNDGGLVARDLNGNVLESMKNAFRDALIEAPSKNVLVVDQVTADQQSANTIEDLATV